MQQYSIVTKAHIIIFTKLDTDEYEFSTTYNYLEYCGKSYLKNLSFVNDFNCYLNEMYKKIKVEHIDSDKFIMVHLPIPYSDEFELIQLKMLKNDDYINKVLKIQPHIAVNINKLEDDFKEIKRKNNKLEDSFSFFKSRFSKLEDSFKEMSDELSRFKIANNICNRTITGLLDINTDIIGSCMKMSNYSDEIEIINYLKKNINKYFNYSNDYVLNMLDKHNKLSLVFGYSKRYILNFINLLASCHFKLTNNSYLSYTSTGVYNLYFEYIKDINIKSVQLFKYTSEIYNIDSAMTSTIKINIPSYNVDYNQYYNITYYY